MIPRGPSRAGPPRRRRRALVATVAAWLLAIGLAACAQPESGGGVASLSGAEGGATATTVAPTAEDFEEARLEWAKCMRENGIDVPDPGADGRITVTRRPGDGVNEEDFEKAEKACEHLRQGFGPRGGQAPEQMQERILALTKCLREHGFNVPDPDFDQGGGRFRQTLPEGIDPESKEFQDAQRECSKSSGLDELRRNGPGGPPTTAP
jgi:hypothetical protein